MITLESLMRVKRPETEIPPVVTSHAPIRVIMTGYAEYCWHINELVEDNALFKGLKIENARVYQDEKVRFTHTTTPHRNNHYLVEINSAVWNEVPEGIIPPYSEKNSNWVTVYEYAETKDSGDMLVFHLPGAWLGTVKEYAGTFGEFVKSVHRKMECIHKQAEAHLHE